MLHESLSVAFNADMPCKGDFSVEIERWRLKVGDNPVHQNIPGLQSTQTCTQRPLSEYSYYFYIVDCSVFYKRSFSALRRPKTRVRSTMTGYRLCGLVMRHFHRNMAVNRENI